MATNKRTTSRDGAEPEVPRRRWGRALLWIGLIGVLVVGAIVVSVVFDNHKSDSDVLAEPPVDTEVFCLTAARFSSFDQIDIASGGADQLRALAVVATQLGSISPAAIEDDFSAVSAALDNVAAAVDAVPTDDPGGIEVVTQKLDDELAAVADQANQAAAYIEHWCGPLDSLGTAPPTSVPTSESSLPGPEGG